MSISTSTHGSRRPLMTALKVFCIGTLLACAAGVVQDRYNTRVANTAFDKVAHSTVDGVLDRINAYEYGLRGARGALLAVLPQRISYQQYVAYAASRDIAKEFPGARGIGLVRRVPKSEEQEYVALQRLHRPRYAVRQLTPHDGERYIIEFIEPEGPNVVAPGLDIASETFRREAALKAMTTGDATLSRPISLLQASSSRNRGFLLLLPIYRPGLPLETQAQRMSACIGWSYAPMVIDEVLKDFRFDRAAFSLRLRDSQDDEGKTFYSTDDGSSAAAAGLERHINVNVFGREWHVEILAKPEYIDELNLHEPIWLVAGGIVISALLSMLAYVQVQSADRARQVRDEQARRSSLLESSSDAIIGQSIDGRISDWNRGAMRLFGHSTVHALGQDLDLLLAPTDQLDEAREIRARVLRGGYLPPFDAVRVDASGARIDVQVVVAPVMDEGGRVVGLSTTMRDIREIKRTEQSFRDLNASLERQVRERTGMLEKAHHDLQTILDAVPSMIGYWDRNLINVVANRAYSAALGIASGSLAGRHAHDVLGDEMYLRKRPYMEAALRGEPQMFEISAPWDNDKTRMRHTLVYYVPDLVDGEVRGFYVLINDVTELTENRMKLASALRDNDALLRTINRHAIVSVADRRGKIIDANDSFCKISGYTHEELLGQDHRIVNSGSQTREFWVEMWRTISSGQPWRGEICNRAKNGTLYWVDSIIMPFVGDDGRIEKYISIRTDITTAKLTEQRLRSSEAFLDRAGRVAGVGGWELDLRTNIVTWSEQTRRIHELPDDYQPSLQNALTFYMPEDLPMIEAAVQEGIRSGSGWDLEARMRTAQGRHIWVRSVGTADVEDGQAIRLVGAFQDITERKQAELQLTHTSSLLSAVLESASEVSMIATDADLTITVFNAGAQRLLGYTRDEVVGQATPMLIHQQEEVDAAAAELSAATGDTIVGGAVFIQPSTMYTPREWTYVRKDGSHVPVSLVVTPMRSADGRTFGYLGIAHDVTRQKQYEQTLHEAIQETKRASLAKSHFVANMSHEIRTPMNAVIGITYLLGQTRLDEEQRPLLSKVERASKSLLAIINDVLDLTKIEAGELLIEHTAFSLPSLLSEVHELIALQARSKRISHQMEIEADVPAHLFGDPTRLRQILLNLLSNAVKFTDQGHVHLRVGTVPGAAYASARLHFEVVDTGIGIPCDVQRKLFMPFAQADASTTRRYGGTGLGLSIVRHLTELMGGTVGLRSEPGQGSCFWVDLPFEVDNSPGSTTANSADDAGSPGLQGLRVMVVDDSDINLDVARRILQLAGARVELAGDGEEALCKLREQPDGFDVVLMDMQMPVLDGHEATRRIRSELGLTDLPVIALTAGALTSERQKALESGMADFISKPFEPPELIRRIRRHVRLPNGPVGALSDEDAALPSPQNDAPWPDIDGMDMTTVRSLFGTDIALYRNLLDRMLREFQVAPGEASHALLHEADRMLLAKRMHKLRGSAGLLGAHEIQVLAGMAEDAARAGDSTRFDELTARLNALLDHLRTASLDFRRSEPRPQVQDPQDLAAYSGRLSELLRLLDEHSLDALDHFTSLKDQLALTCDPALFETLQAHVEDLQFAEARHVLDRIRSMSGP